ncbi:MAG: ABC transporter substrate-binding protein, partial [Candidatus Marinimicrobia bacterium]|nr:ABC transporter substrate-binding protein [Candidatus Neomarinimicrobiota bacterium]
FDVLFIPDATGMVNMIAPQLQYNGIDVDLMGTNLWNSKKTPLVTDYVQGAIFPDGFYPESESEKTANFLSLYSEATGSLPGYSEIIAYDTATIVMSTLSSAAVTSREEMVKYLQSNTFDNTITCPTSFDLQGEPVKSLELFQVTGNEIKLIRSCDN